MAVTAAMPEITLRGEFWYLRRRVPERYQKIETRQVIKHCLFTDSHGHSARPPNPVASKAMQWFLAGFRPPEWPDKD